jgi:hypothetical protein
MAIKNPARFERCWVFCFLSIEKREIRRITSSLLQEQQQELLFQRQEQQQELLFRQQEQQQELLFRQQEQQQELLFQQQEQQEQLFLLLFWNKQPRLQPTKMRSG